MQPAPVKWKIITLGLAIIGLSACSSTNAPVKPVDTINLGQLEDLNQSNNPQTQKSGKLNPIRTQGLKEAAMSVGAQGALGKRSVEIDAMLTKNSRYLDQIFNFNSLMLPKNVLPPVLLEGDNTLNLADSTTIRISDKMYTIAQQAKFVTVPPTWHDYLWMSFPKPDAPDNSLLPKNSTEEAVWKKNVALGWKQGAEQANNIFGDNVARLKRDYEGMILYHELVNQNMISVPYVASTKLGVTGGGGSMTVNDQVQRLTDLPTLNANSQYWKPAVKEQNPTQTITSQSAQSSQSAELPADSQDMGIK